MKARTYLVTMLRESRGSRGRLVFFTACLALGVAAMVGVSSLVMALETGIRASARELLAADLEASSRQPLPPEIDDVFADLPGVERTDIREMATMVAAPARDDGQPGRSRLVQLEALAGRYPLYGEVTLTPPGTVGELLTDETAIVAPETLAALGLAIGDDILVNRLPFRIAATIEESQDNLGFSAMLGPRVIVSAGGHERTGLSGFGVRDRYKALYRFPDDPDAEQLVAYEERIREALPERSRVRLENWQDAQPTVRRALVRVERYLGLVALLSLILGGTGVAQIVRTWLVGRTASIAVLRCLGYQPRQILVLYLGHVMLLAVVASTIGGLLGCLLPFVLPYAAPDLVPRDLVQGWQPFALLRGIGLGVGIALVFSLPPLSAIWRVTPARVLRAEAAPLPPRRLVSALTWLALAAGVFGASSLQTDSLLRGGIFTGGLALLVLLLAGVSRGTMALSGQLRRMRMSPYLVHGLAALARPGAGTTGAIVALGLGVLVVFTLYIVEARLDRFLRTVLPASAPSAFLADVQPDQWEGVRAILEEEGSGAIDSVPVVMARIASLDGQTIDEIMREDPESGGRFRGDDDDDDDGGRRDGRRGRSRWGLTREQRLTWREELPEDNVILAGELWSDPERAEVSLEEGYAENLGVSVGSTIVFDVQGVPIELLVSSVRTVDWRSFGINFFIVVEPGVLEDAPHFRIAAARLSEEREQAIQDRLIADFPNVTLINVRSIITRVMELLNRLAFGVQVLGGFTMLTGLAILAGAVSTTTLRRGREAALLKTMGVTVRGVTRLFATEYALWGLLAGFVGGGGALLLAWGALDVVLEMPPELPWLAWPVAILLTVVLAAGCGLAASARALRSRPVEALRG